MTEIEQYGARALAGTLDLGALAEMPSDAAVDLVTRGEAMPWMVGGGWVLARWRQHADESWGDVQREAAEIFKRSERTIRRWVEQAAKHFDVEVELPTQGKGGGGNQRPDPTEEEPEEGDEGEVVTGDHLSDTPSGTLRTPVTKDEWAWFVGEVRNAEIELLRHSVPKDILLATGKLCLAAAGEPMAELPPPEEPAPEPPRKDVKAEGCDHLRWRNQLSNNAGKWLCDDCGADLGRARPTRGKKVA